MPRPITNIRTIQDAVRYWRECLDEWGKKPDHQIATSIVCLGASDHFEEWDAKEGGQKTDVSKLFWKQRNIMVNMRMLEPVIGRK